VLVRSEPVEEPIVSRLAVENGPPQSEGATVRSASGVVAREVLLADAANLLRAICDRAGEGRRSMPTNAVKALGASVSIAVPETQGTGPGLRGGLGSIVTRREVTR
jgi:hypothetical protein